MAYIYHNIAKKFAQRLRLILQINRYYCHAFVTALH